jgi:hypothetical protein
MTDSNPLQIGVVMDGVRAPAWAAWMLTAIRAHDDLELTLAVSSGRIRDGRRSVLFAAYEALDRRVFAHPPDALEPVDISNALDGVSRLQLPKVHAQASRDEQGREDPDPDEHSLDVLVCLGATITPREIPLVARHGIWSLHVGDPDRFRGEPALFWELYFAEAASMSVLEAVAGSPEERRVLYRSSTATDPVSLQRTRNAVYWKSARFVLRRLEDLATGRWNPKLEPPDHRPSRRRTPPSNADAIRHVTKLAGRVARRRLRRAAFRHQWFLGIRRRRPDTLPYEDPNPWKVIAPPADRYWADPFVLRGDGVTHIFFEQVRYADGKGELAVARLERTGELSTPEPVLRAAHQGTPS